MWLTEEQGGEKWEMAVTSFKKKDIDIVKHSTRLSEHNSEKRAYMGEEKWNRKNWCSLICIPTFNHNNKYLKTFYLINT